MITENINQKIERKRQELVKTAKQYGYISHQSIKVSQELDHLLNQFSGLKKENLGYNHRKI